MAAEEAARLGKKVAVVEKKSIGGTWLNVDVYRLRPISARSLVDNGGS